MPLVIEEDTWSLNELIMRSRRRGGVIRLRLYSSGVDLWWWLYAHVWSGVDAYFMRGGGQGFGPRSYSPIYSPIVLYTGLTYIWLGYRVGRMRKYRDGIESSEQPGDHEIKIRDMLLLEWPRLTIRFDVDTKGLDIKSAIVPVDYHCTVLFKLLPTLLL